MEENQWSVPGWGGGTRKMQQVGTQLAGLGARGLESRVLREDRFAGEHARQGNRSLMEASGTGSHKGEEMGIQTWGKSSAALGAADALGKTRTLGRSSASSWVRARRTGLEGSPQSCGPHPHWDQSKGRGGGWKVTHQHFTWMSLHVQVTLEDLAPRQQE